MKVLRCKSINKLKEKDAIDEIENEEPSVIDYPVINDPIYVSLFQCGKNPLNRIYSTFKQADIATSRDRYYTENCKTLTGYNGRKNTPLSNENIREAICKFMVEE